MKIAGLLVLILCWALSAPAADFDHSYAKLNRVLSRHIVDHRVDYAALKNNSKELNEALDDAAAVKKSDFAKWNQPQQIAFLINLYNGSALRLVLDHYPLKSIKGIGNILRGPFKQPAVRLFGETTTLEQVERGLLRKSYREPRIHFALVCAARSCPPLRREAYVGDRLNEQLDDQGRKFLAQKEMNRVDAREQIVYLSPIFKWFSEDFERTSGSVLKFVTPFFPGNEPKVLRGAKQPWKIRYTDYDWSLNDKSAR